jgi:pyruvate dehydrogenase E2 component (dihydrolipoamide acetyltransferase)
VRRLSRELGIDIGDVRGTGPGGRISEEDVKNYARNLIARAGQSAAPAGAAPARPIPVLPDFSQWGAVEREPLSKIRRVTAEAMSTSWSMIPHVTQFDRADITELEDWRRRHGARVERDSGGKLTVTAILVRILAEALKAYPRFNASLDDASGELVLKQYVNIGVAVDTPHGLLVPVIKQADEKTIGAIATELGELAARARARKASLEDLSGANLNLSNLGGLGTTYFSPIVAWPQVAVIGVGRATMEPLWREGEFEPRLILPLAVSYDHRVIDGADAARFLRWVAEALEQPLRMFLEA